MPGYYRPIPEYIATHDSLTSDEKLFYGILAGLINQYGYCWPSNEYLKERARVSKRTVQRYIHKLANLNLIIVEIETNNDRKIWTPETWGNRENLLKAYGKEAIDCRENFNQRFYTHDTIAVTPPRQQLCHHINKETNKKKHIEAWAKPAKSKPTPPAKPSVCTPIPKNNSAPGDKRQLPSKLKGPPPTPGPKVMVADTKKVLERPMKIGTQTFLIHPHDFEYFYGYSPTVVEQAIYRTNIASLNGTRIANIPAYIFARCAEIRKEQNG